ncbi:protein angel homolog 2-like isoform X2 [Limulus polyphemus]|nr:protein angel homolog 2-like isoform X2 [Limulus polyphemus]
MLFTVMSYNILAQDLLESNMFLYEHCSPECLTWEYRKNNLLKEIRKAAVDVICFQEVQVNHYHMFWKPQLMRNGYQGVFKKRTEGKTDGCAIFFKTKLFSIEKCIPVEFYKPRISKLLDKDNIGLIVVLRPVIGVSSDYSGSLVIANTHLLYNPVRGDIKLAQLCLFLSEIDKAAYRGLSKRSKRPMYNPIIFCGDLNLIPNSPLYTLIVKGELWFNGLLAGDMSGQEFGAGKGRRLGSINLPGPDESTPEKACHLLNLLSVYNYESPEEEKKVTTFNNNNTSQSVDFIFYSVEDKLSILHKGKVYHEHANEKSLKLIAHYNLLTHQQLKSTGGLPNFQNSSDHLPLLAKFLLRDL